MSNFAHRLLTTLSLAHSPLNQELPEQTGFQVSKLGQVTSQNQKECGHAHTGRRSCHTGFGGWLLLPLPLPLDTHSAHRWGFWGEIRSVWHLGTLTLRGGCGEGWGVGGGGWACARWPHTREAVPSFCPLCVRSAVRKTHSQITHAAFVSISHNGVSHHFTLQDPSRFNWRIPSCPKKTSFLVLVKQLGGTHFSFLSQKKGRGH